MYVGLDTWMPAEDEVISALGLRRPGSGALAESSAPVLSWIASEGITHLAVHFEVDALAPKHFGPQLVNMSDAPADFLAGVPRGRLAPDHVVRLLHDVAAACDIVGLAITKYMPWEAITTRNLLRGYRFLAADVHSVGGAPVWAEEQDAAHVRELLHDEVLNIVADVRRHPQSDDDIGAVPGNQCLLYLPARIGISTLLWNRLPNLPAVWGRLHWNHLDTGFGVQAIARSKRDRRMCM